MHTWLWCRAVLEQRDEGREGTVEGITIATLEQHMFMNSLTTTGNVDGCLKGQRGLKPESASVGGIYFAIPKPEDKKRVGEVMSYVSLAISPPTPSLNVESCKSVSLRRGGY